MVSLTRGEGEIACDPGAAAAEKGAPLRPRLDCFKPARPAGYVFGNADISTMKEREALRDISSKIGMLFKERRTVRFG